MTILTAVTLASDVILGITLLVFLRQTRHMAQATRAEVYQTISQQMMAIDHLFIDHPELRAHFYAGKPLPDDETDRARILATAELFIDFMDNVMAQRRHLPEEMADSWTGYFRSIAGSSPPIRGFWSEHRDWYAGPLTEMMDGACAGDPLAQPAADAGVKAPHGAGAP